MSAETMDSYLIICCETATSQWFNGCVVVCFNFKRGQ